jgi:MYXO-CTERM domain-containing protein
MHKLALAICLMSVAVPFAAAQNGGNGSTGQNLKQAPKRHGHAPEMSSSAMAVAGVIGLGGYLLIRRRVSWQR